MLEKEPQGGKPIPRRKRKPKAAPKPAPEPTQTGGGGGGGGGRTGGGGGGYSGGGGGGGDIGSLLPKPSINDQEMAAEYGWSLAFLRQNPELNHLFNRAVANSWTPQRFVAELRGTKWFQNHSATARQYYVNKVTDPTTWRQDVARNAESIQTVREQLTGIRLAPKVAQRWAMRAMRLGWTADQIKTHLVDSINWQHAVQMGGRLGGSAAEARGNVQQLLSQYGVGMGIPGVAGLVKHLMTGQQTMGGVTDRIKNLAKSKYSGFADALDSGQTMDQIADPYIQSAAQLLEKSPDEISIRTPLIQRALTRRQDGKPAPMDLNEFEDAVRHTDAWLHTDQANQEFTDAAQNLLQSWGLM